MTVLVQKFGGTSVRNSEVRSHAIEHVKNAVEEGHQIVAVVSAMGRKDEPYATDTLLGLVNYPNNHVTNRELDLLMSCGEVISSVIFTNELIQHGISAASITGAQAGILTTNDFTDARINKINTELIETLLQTNQVIVVAGFQGQDQFGNITTLGRGGSDTSAIALGAALEAKYVDIFTDVDGIKTADPVLVKHAKTLKAMTYNEIVHLAYQGSKVIHPRAVEIAMQEKIPIRVRSTYSENAGTLVTSKVNNTIDRDIQERLVTGIAQVSGLIQINIEATDQLIQFHDDVFQKLAEANISVDFFNISTNGITFTIPKDKWSLTQSIIESMELSYNIVKDCAKVSTVGAAIQGVPGVASKIVTALATNHIQILQSADSHTTIWVLIKEKDLEKAVNALHDSFLSKKGV
ncbi:aspartate kinase [Tenuibacillus multivorans]|uniref:Aspartokinase n=1 Tax=Tenuibacillus multivorans TaxID=237069 RepID=A0A1G9XVM1_9BACI|nr:aspartate kinase [Tenuibacillus multivorans]GEL75823.1 aspartokinase [Tenuibacillus multivorans]SDN00476.1 aspartate kinase [Tenuibacillus multivorans]